MGEPRLSKILIGGLFIGLISLAFMLFLSSGAEEYSTEGYTNSSLERFTSTSKNISTIAQDSEGNLSQTGAINNGFDIFGSFFSNAWTALKSTWNSINVISSLSSDSVNELPALNSEFRNQLNTFITISVLIVMVIGIFFHFIKTSGRL